MKTTGFKGRDFLAETDYTPQEIKSILKVAEELKTQTAMGVYHDNLLRAKTLFMIFYNQSLRTRNSFEAGMTQLGGHAHFLDLGESKMILDLTKMANWEELVYDSCTMCGRCTMACPVGNDITMMIRKEREAMQLQQQYFDMQRRMHAIGG